MADFLITQLAERLDVSPDVAEAALETLVDDIQAELALGQTVTLPGIGTFRQDITGTQFAPDVSLTDAVNMSYSGLGHLSLDAGGGPIAELSSTAADLTDPTAYTLPDDGPEDDTEDDETDGLFELSAPDRPAELSAAERPAELPEAERPAALPPASFDDDETLTDFRDTDEPAGTDEAGDTEDVTEDVGEADLSADTILDDDFPPLPQAEDADTLEDLLLPDPFADEPMVQDDTDAAADDQPQAFDAPADLDESLLPDDDETDDETDDDWEEEETEDTDALGTLEPIEMDLEVVDMPGLDAASEETDADELEGLSFLGPPDEEEPLNLSFLTGDEEEDTDEDGWNEPDDDEHPLGPASTVPMEEADFSVMPPPDDADDETFDFIEGLGEPEYADDEQDDFAFPPVPSLEADEGLAPEQASALQPHPDIPSSATPRLSMTEEDMDDEEDDRRPLFLIGAVAVVLVLVLALITYQFVLKEDPAQPVATETPIDPNAPTNPEQSGNEGTTPGVDGQNSGTESDPNATTGPSTQPPGAFALPYLGGIDFAQGGWTLIVASETLFSRASVRASSFQSFNQPIEILQGQNEGLTRYRIALGQFEGASAANNFKRQNAAQLPNGAWVLRIRPEMRYTPQ